MGLKKGSKYSGSSHEHRIFPQDYSELERAQLYAWYRDNDAVESVRSKLDWLAEYEAKNGKLNMRNVINPYLVMPARSYITTNQYAQIGEE